MPLGHDPGDVVDELHHDAAVHGAEQVGVEDGHDPAERAARGAGRLARRRGGFGHGAQGYGRRSERTQGLAGGLVARRRPWRPRASSRRPPRGGSSGGDALAVGPSSAPAGPGAATDRTRAATPRTAAAASAAVVPADREAAARRPPAAATFARSRSSRAGGAGRWTSGCCSRCCSCSCWWSAALLYFFCRIEKVDALHDYDGRPAAASGTNWLIVGSDSREGLSDEEVKDLHLGKVGGRRTDTIILLHKPESGAPTLVSLPRDSYVPIPGHGRDKLNAAYAFGGAPLLAQTVETVTGLRIDHYAEVGFGGFVGMTDAVGGVELCPKRNIRDHKSGLNVAKGCQEMDGATALAYVRARYFDPQGDLGRVQRQQEFLGAVFDEAVEPGDAAQPVPHPVARQRRHHGADHRRGRRPGVAGAVRARDARGGRRRRQPDHGAGGRPELPDVQRCLGRALGPRPGPRAVPLPRRQLTPAAPR